MRVGLGPKLLRQLFGVTLDVIDIGRLDNGKLVEHWGVPDRLAVLLQLGMFPPHTP